jgi:hypothetical protein
MLAGSIPFRWSLFRIRPPCPRWPSMCSGMPSITSCRRTSGFAGWCSNCFRGDADPCDGSRLRGSPCSRQPFRSRLRRCWRSRNALSCWRAFRCRLTAPSRVRQRLRIRGRGRAPKLTCPGQLGQRRAQSRRIGLDALTGAARHQRRGNNFAAIAVLAQRSPQPIAHRARFDVHRG